MRKALWFVVRNFPHRSGDTPDHFPSSEEVKRKLHDKIAEVAGEPLKQGNTLHSGPIPVVVSGEADSTKLEIVEVSWKSPH